MGFSVMRIWPICGSVFRFSHFKTELFRFWCLVRFAGFLQFNLWFLSTMIAVFRIFLPNAFCRFSAFAKEVTPCSRAKAVIPRDHLQLEECMTSVVSLAAVIRVVTGCQADYETDKRQRHQSKCRGLFLKLSRS